MDHLAKVASLLSEEQPLKSADKKEDFDERVKSFLSSKKFLWAIKPVSLSPAACAQYGWKCIGEDLISCVTCNSQLCVALPKVWNTKVYEQCEKQILASLRSAHKKNCPWPICPSSDSLVYMRPLPKRHAYKEFTNRLESLLQIKELLPRIKEGLMEKLGITEPIIRSIYTLSNIPDEENSKSALVMAATGWTRSTNLQMKKYAVCLHCHRSVALWMYGANNCETDDQVKDQNKETSPIESPTNSKNMEPEKQVNHTNKNNGNNDDCSSFAKKRKVSLDITQPFDPLYDHRHWCIWVVNGKGYKESELEKCPNGDNKNKEKPGWKIFLESLLSDMTNEESSSLISPTKEQLNKARRMLETWITPVTP